MAEAGGLNKRRGVGYVDIQLAGERVRKAASASKIEARRELERLRLKRAGTPAGTADDSSNS